MFWIRQSVPYLEKQWSKVQDYCTVCCLHSSQSKCSDRGWVKIITSFCPHWWPDRRLRTTMAGYDFPAVVQAVHMVAILFRDFILFSSSAKISDQSTITFHGRSWFCCYSQWQSRLCDRTSWYSGILAMVTVWTMCLTNSYCFLQTLKNELSYNYWWCCTLVSDTFVKPCIDMGPRVWLCLLALSTKYAARVLMPDAVTMVCPVPLKLDQYTCIYLPLWSLIFFHLSEWRPSLWSHILTWAPEFGIVYWHCPLCCKSINQALMSTTVTMTCPMPLKLAWDTGMYLFLTFLSLFHLSEWHPSLWRRLGGPGNAKTTWGRFVG